MVSAAKLEKDIEVLRDPDYGYIRAGYPRFMRFFGRDSLITAWQLLDVNPENCKLTLGLLSKQQGKGRNEENQEEPGKILHETDFRFDKHPQYPDFKFPYYGSIDSTPLFIIIFNKYIQKTGDTDFLKNHKENIEKAVQWIRDKISSDSKGFVRYGEIKRDWHLKHQGWKDAFDDHIHIKPPVAMVEVQGYAYKALLDAIKLLEGGPSGIEKEAQELKERFNTEFWMVDKNFYALALDGDDKQRQAITSNPGHLLFTGIIDKPKSDFVVGRLMESDMFTDYGIRTHSSKESDFDYKSYHLGTVWPHDNWIIAQGCKEMGYREVYERIRESTLKAYNELGVIPEHYGVTADGKLETIQKAAVPQAWASAALLEFINSKNKENNE